MDIYNYYRYSDLISTSGLPEVKDFNKIKAEGFEIVLSLSMPVDSKTIENEELLLSNLGMTYMHIPVDYYDPKVRDFEVFQKFINAYKTEKLWIHCTKNYRVSAFIYLYHLLQTDEAKNELLNMFWTPNEVWQTFINDVITSRSIC